MMEFLDRAFVVGAGVVLALGVFVEIVHPIYRCIRDGWEGR